MAKVPLNIAFTPPPKSISGTQGTYPKSEQYRLRCAFSPTERFAGSVETGDLFSLAPCKGASPPIELRIDSSLVQSEAYRLSIEPRSIVAAAASESGLFRALSTLSQIHRDSQSDLPCLEIEDSPDLPNRGYMLDISRCKVPKIESLFELIDRLALLKYNQLQLYTEHAFAYEGRETIWKDASPYTAQDIQAIDTYCHERYIEMVPNQNSFGHMDRWLRHDAYKRLAESPNGYAHPILGSLPWGGTLKPDSDSIQFVSELFDELLPNFRSDQFNIGGDEPWELGQGASADICKVRGKHRVYLDHLLALQTQVALRGKTMQFWGDIILESPELARELQADCLGLIWGYEADHPFDTQCAAFADAQRPFYTAPGTSAWNSIGGRWENARSNIEDAARQAIRHGGNGLLLTDWGDFGHHHAPPISWPAIVWASAASWNFQSLNTIDVSSFIDSVFLANDRAGLAHSILELGNAANGFAYRQPNRTLLNDLLFANPDRLADLADRAAPEELERARDHLHTLRSSLSSTMSNASQQIVRDELLLSADLLIKATEKGLRQAGATIPDTLSWSDLIDRFQALWLQRNRPGGLKESRSYFEKACE